MPAWFIENLSRNSSECRPKFFGMSPKILRNVAQNSSESRPKFSRMSVRREPVRENFLLFGRILGRFGRIFGRFGRIFVRENFGYYSGEFWVLFGRILGIIRENFGYYSGEFWLLFGRILVWRNMVFVWPCLAALINPNGATSNRGYK